MYCQKCRTPLKLDSSLEDLNPVAYDLLIATASQPPSRKHPQPRPANAPDADRRALYEQVAKNAGPPTFKRHSGGGSGGGTIRDSAAMSFVLLSESTVAAAGTGARERQGSSAAGARNGSVTGGDGASGQDGGFQGDTAQAASLERITKLFEILSARSDVDHPVCVECTELLVEGLQQRLDAAARERDAYVGFLKRAQAAVPEEDEREAEAALALAQAQEAEALAELRRLEADKAQLDREIAGLEAEARALDAAEEEFWRGRNAFATTLAAFQNERDSVNARYDHDARLLERLQRSNVYNDTFCISHDGTFATINGLRLGRLAARPVDWPEINAAWGHALLLLVTVADKLGYRFQHYEPLPMGSTSRIIRYDPPSPTASRLDYHNNNNNNNNNNSGPPPAPKKHVLELYSSGDMPLGLTFMHRRFDNAMVAFLELVRQLGVFVHQQTAAAAAAAAASAAAGAAASPNGGHALSLPYRIEGDKIGDVSIKLGIAQDDGWTKACKLTLTCCKFLLAHASNVNSASASART